MSRYPIHPEDVHAILSHLELPLADTLPIPPIDFLVKYLVSLPPSLLAHFDFITPRQRASVPAIKHRRLLRASSVPTPGFLTASEGRLRWPLLWERLGGDPFPPPSQGLEEEEDWVKEGFMRDVDSSQQVKKLGGFLRLLEEEREAEGVRDAKRRERRMDTEGEEFDEESDEEEEDLSGQGQNGNVDRPEIAEDQAQVTRSFEKRLLEIFLDGLDTIDYALIDYNEPEGVDPIALRDAEDRYFDDEEPSRTPGGHVQGENAMQNGAAEYDY
ncbi:hypothetical protein IAU60_001537 [Kwoniella sp. DSM 27419]